MFLFSSPYLCIIGMLFTFYSNVIFSARFSTYTKIVIFITILNVLENNVEFPPLSTLSNHLLRLRNNEIGTPNFSVASIIVDSTFFKACQ